MQARKRERMQDATPVIAVLGLGEAGSLLARDLVRGGHTVRGWDPDLHGDLSEIPVASSFADAVAPADVVLSVNWAIVAADVAREAVPHLRAGRVYADLNTSGPALKAQLAEIVAPTGAAFVDVAMMSPVPGFGIRVPMFLAGDGADALADLLRPLGTPVEIVGTTPGEAAARKLTRSVFFKGMSAAVGEALEAARAAGVEDWLRSDITRTFVGADGSTLDRIVEGTRKHAKRRAHEMRDAAALLDELGVPHPVTDATVASLERTLRRAQGDTNDARAPAHDDAATAPAHDDGATAPAHDDGATAPAHDDGARGPAHDDGASSPSASISR